MPSERPYVPTSELVLKYSGRFDSGEVSLADRTLAELFRTFPQNQQLEHVMLKVVTLNALYYTSIMATARVAEHILRCETDTRLERHDPQLVNDIALVKVKENKTMRFYSFATKYCSWHVPDAYPIYDRFVAMLLWRYQRLDRFSSFKQNDLWNDYLVFINILQEFRDYYGLTEFSFKQLDKFLWLYGKEYFSRTKG